MTDVRTLLSNAADPAEVDDAVVAADLARARRVLRRRTAGRATVSALAATAVVAGVGIARSDPAPRPLAQPPASSAPAVPTTPAAKPPVRSNAPVRLVAYTGEQPTGYKVSYVPKGWEIQGANEFRLTIAAIGTKDTHPDGFVGKLVVMSQSQDASGPPMGKKIAVGDGFGYLSRTEPTTAVLTYEDASGKWVVVQVPPVLKWSDREIGRFAAGVEVTADAAPTRG